MNDRTLKALLRKRAVRIGVVVTVALFAATAFLAWQPFSASKAAPSASASASVSTAQSPVAENDFSAIVKACRGKGNAEDQEQCFTDHLASQKHLTIVGGTVDHLADGQAQIVEALRVRVLASNRAEAFVKKSLKAKKTNLGSGANILIERHGTAFTMTIFTNECFYNYLPFTGTPTSSDLVMPAQYNRAELCASF